MRLRLRRRSVLLAAALAALAITGTAGAKSFTLPQAEVSVQVAKNGSLLVTSRSPTTSAGRSPVATARSRSAPASRSPTSPSARTGAPYRSGGCTELGCLDDPGTFGAADLGHAVRIVWHYAASNERRTFVVHYRLNGVAVAYDDVVDVDLQVWGSEWKEPLGRLTAAETAPGKILRAWGHPVYVRGDVQLAGKRVLLRALNVPAGQFVELRTVIPRSAFTSTAGMRVAAGHRARRRSSPRRRRMRRASRRTSSRSTTRSSIHGATRSTCSCSARCRHSSSSAASSGSTAGS